MTIFHSESSDYQKSCLNFWDRDILLQPNPLGSYYHQCLVDTYKNLVLSDSIVLELDFEVGDLLAQLNPSFRVGIDFSKNAISIAQSRPEKIIFSYG